MILRAAVVKLDSWDVPGQAHYVEILGSYNSEGITFTSSCLAMEKAQRLAEQINQFLQQQNSERKISGGK